MSRVHLAKENLVGSHNWKGDLELLNIIMIGIAENLPEKEENFELHRLLSALLSSNLEVEEMCNLSQGIKEKAFEGGYAEGKQNGYAEAICMMYKSGLPIEQIAEIIKMSTDRVKELLNFDLSC